MPSNKPVKVLTKAALLRLARRAERLNLNRKLRLSALQKLPDDALFPISAVFLHNDDHFRCHIVLDEQPTTVELDMTVDDYNRIPAITLP